MALVPKRSHSFWIKAFFFFHDKQSRTRTILFRWTPFFHRFLHQRVVADLTLEERTCLNLLFSSCMLGDLGLARWRPPLLFSPFPPPNARITWRTKSTWDDLWPTRVSNLVTAEWPPIVANRCGLEWILPMVSGPHKDETDYFRVALDCLV